MKFSCDRCGKKYATADEPVSGRVYKLKCKSCGHLIVVKGSASAGAPARAPAAREPAADAALPDAIFPPSPTPPGLSLASTAELDLPAPADRTQDLAAPASAPSWTPPPVPEHARAAIAPEEPFSRVTPVDGLFAAPEAAPLPDDPAPELAATPPEPAPPPGLPAAAAAADGGYVDLFADAPEASSEDAGTADPFFAAARSSLPESFNAGSADPFAPMRAELGAAATTGADAPPDTSRPLPAPKVPDIPRPPPQKNGLPVALIGAGVAVMVGILVFALTMGGKKAPAAGGAAVAAAPAPPLERPPEPAGAAPEPQPQPEPQAAKAEAAAAPTAEAPPPAPATPAEAPRVAQVERAPERQPQRKPERKAEPRPQRAPPARAEKVAAAAPAPASAPQPAAADATPEPPASAEPEVPDVPEGLSQDQIQKVLASTRKAFDACIANGAKDSGVTLDGRKVALRLNIQPNGSATYPMLDDVTLNATPVGACLKSAARMMVFPRFRGDPVRIEVPLTLSR